MKRKYILLPITLTALAPTIGMVGCDSPESDNYNVKIDSDSDTTNIVISKTQITLNEQLVVHYEIINSDKELDVDNSWVKFESSSQLPLSNPEFSYDNNQVIIPANKVTTYDIAICLKTKDIAPDPTEYDLTIIPDEFAHVTPSKFKKRNTLVINYSLDHYCSLSRASTITIGSKSYSISKLIHDDTTITLSASIMNSSSVVVKLIGVEYWPEQFHVIDQFTSWQTSANMVSSTFSIEIDNTYYFKIDSNSWKGSKAADSYTNLGIVIKGGKSIIWKQEDFKIIIDGETVSNDQYEFFRDTNGDWARFYNDSIKNKILNGKTIVGRVHVDSFREIIEPCYFKLYGDFKHV